MPIFIYVSDLGKEGKGAADDRGHRNAVSPAPMVAVYQAEHDPPGQLSPSLDLHHSTNTGWLLASC